MGLTLLWEKRTGTYADTLAAVGLAATLQSLTDAEVTIRNTGSSYTLSLDVDVDFGEIDYAELQAAPGFTFIKTGKESSPPAVYVDYSKERERLLTYRKMQKEIPLKQRADEDIRRQLQQVAPLGGRLGRWYTIQNINVLRAVSGMNKLHQAIREADAQQFAEYVRERLELLAAGKGSAVPKRDVKISASPLQIFNPTVGKGVNRPKPDSVTPSSLPRSFVDWFEEWMKYVGFETCGRALSVGEDTKIAVLDPVDIRMSDLRVSAERWLDLMPPWSPVKFDVFLVLGMARILISLSEARASNSSRWRRRRPRSIVGGIQVAHFKSMGSSKSVCNTSFIALPGWLPSVDAANAATWVTVLDEHRSVLQALNEDESEDAELLAAYRDFLSHPDVKTLCRFFGGFSVLVMRRIVAGKPYRRFSAELFEKVVEQVDNSLVQLLRNPAFREIAQAIRSATVTEQYHKRNGTQEFEIQYGLIPELKRKAQFPEQFIAALADFVSRYNTESARHLETGRGRRRRSRVSAEALEAILPALVAYGKTAALLLIAYATCRAPQEEPADHQENGTGSDSPDLRELDQGGLDHE